MASLEVNVRQAGADFTAIKEKIVANGVEVAEGTRTAEYAQKVDEVYEAGKKAEYDAFWDAYQNSGARHDYCNAFYGANNDSNPWNDALFKPKYDLVCTNVNYMFANSRITNLKQLLQDCGVRFVSNTAEAYYTFFFSYITHIPDFCGVELTNCENAFLNCFHLVSIDKIKSAETCSFAGAFINCRSLENVTIEGVIGRNGLNMKDCVKLSKASIESIINCLSTTTSGLTVTLSKTAVNNAFTADEWEALIATRTNWTISLV